MRFEVAHWPWMGCESLVAVGRGEAEPEPEPDVESDEAGDAVGLAPAEQPARPSANAAASATAKAGLAMTERRGETDMPYCQHAEAVRPAMTRRPAPSCTGSMKA
ncbi:hypothetical protein [Leifsonia sp. P73]|uniref:hypothetical protein n=1 Tax=Leifsonia sp. P73 TaxID=3423959 RepID=UPI003DA3E1E9